eukprot:6169782-Pleurochrysis_carterae.AAC.1
MPMAMYGVQCTHLRVCIEYFLLARPQKSPHTRTRTHGHACARARSRLFPRVLIRQLPPAHASESMRLEMCEAEPETTCGCRYTPSSKVSARARGAVSLASSRICTHALAAMCTSVKRSAS